MAFGGRTSVTLMLSVWNAKPTMFGSSSAVVRFISPLVQESCK